jgi:hypothetical protein
MFMSRSKRFRSPNDWDAFAERICRKIEKRFFEKLGAAFSRFRAWLDEVPSAVEALADLPTFDRIGEPEPRERQLFNDLAQFAHGGGLAIHNSRETP